MIKTYGLHWRLDRISWGKTGAGHIGTLCGSTTLSAKARPIDFRNQRGIYALYADYDLIYIGQTGTNRHRLFDRLKEHMKDHLSERWNRFSWFGTQWVTAGHKLSCDTAAIHEYMAHTLNILEAISIAIAEPRLNLQRGKWNAAKRYFQYWERSGNEFKDDE